ncbi:shikimate dehydrogenase family protein [Mesonia aquimarina]|uniref:shikimate dehydrogenase family protein n=1 Tax=Mesonia aquimarina TaxID=1504967 RepID=UPI000EF59573|nr:shikimate dehydrogenase [Mesonia aquimarina]
MRNFGLIGKNIAYSFSKNYFEQKFAVENIDANYQNFDLDQIDDIKKIILNQKLNGVNITIPYKEKILAHLDSIDEEAFKIGAVNTVKVVGQKLLGYNTDCLGFMKSLFPLLEKQHQNALVLGTGGAAKAVTHALNSLGIDYKSVSRQPKEYQFSYEEINEEILHDHPLIINCTPLGTAPNIDDAPPIPYQYLNQQHLLYDLVYNPPLTTFLANGKKQGCKLSNGHKMLEYQAEQAWKIWNNH